MKIIIDTCSLINIHNSNMLQVVLNISEIEFYIGPITLSECIEIRDVVDRAIDDRKLFLLSDETASPERFINLIDTYGLGDGETECLNFSLDGSYIICTDDKKVRRVCTELLGSTRVTGSLGLLRIGVSKNYLSSNDAYHGYLRMLENGAFLPEVREDFFSSPEDN